MEDQIASPEGTSTRDGHRNSPRKTGDLSNDYARLSASHKLLRNRFKEAKQALEKRRNERDLWIQYADSLKEKIRAAEKEHGIRILDRGAPREDDTVLSAAAEHRSESQQNASLTTGTRSKHRDPGATSHTRAQSHRNSCASTDQRPSESTQGEPEERLEAPLPRLPSTSVDEVEIKEEPSSDGAVFVSERCIKKRKLDTDDADTPTAPVVKQEPVDQESSPVLSRHHCDFNPQESLDLGAHNAVTYTPRKRKDLDQSSPRAHQRGNAAEAWIGNIARSSPKRPRIPPRPTDFSSALTPRDVNRRLSRSSIGIKSENKPLRKGLSQGIAELADDGALYTEAAHQTPMTTSEIQSAVGGRLNDLLNSPSAPEDYTPISLKRGRRLKSAVDTRGELAIPGPRTLPFDKGARSVAKDSESHTAQPSEALSLSSSAAAQDFGTRQARAPSKSLLRNRPLSQLKLDDFKINPSVNEGHDFAYSEVVRDKDERACLPGCIDMHCCGKQFRALALSQRPDPPLSATQRQEEQKLLEEYLGDYSYRLATITKEERLEFWIEAKTRELSNKYSRHRHRFSRMRSPPGFWNADFPDTQELEKDRTEATKRERASVQQRYREAMRSGGRWTFRDE